MNVNQLKNFVEEGQSTDDLIALSAFATSMQMAYTQYGQDVPEWLVSASNRLDREIKSRFSDEVERQIKAVEAQLDKLKTTEERRTDLTSTLERLKALRK